MSSETTIRELMHDADNLMSAGEPVKNARKQFQLETLRSLILVDESGPVGLLTRSTMRQLSDSELAQPARDFAVSVPILQQSQSLASARSTVDGVEFDADRIPVVNDEGRFVGVIDREVVMREAQSVVAAQGHVDLDGQSYTLESGMQVYGVDDNKLGKIDQIIIDRDRVGSFTVAHGLFGRHHKRLSAEHLRRVEDGAAYVDFGKTEFGLLADLEELEEDSSMPVAAS